MSARDRVLGRVRSAVLKRAATEHPGGFEGWRPSTPGMTRVEGFQALFEAAGGEFVACDDLPAAAAWLERFSADFSTVTVGETVPGPLQPVLPRVESEYAELGVSMARAAVAETGSLVLDARDGRRAQLLTPTHVVVVTAQRVHGSLREVLAQVAADPASAIGLHSGPSKSADIGQIMVKGVHGPGRLVALVVG